MGCIYRNVVWGKIKREKYRLQGTREINIILDLAYN
jgi:hypothetical protein